MEPCPSCDSEFPDFDGTECKCGYRRRSRKKKVNMAGKSGKKPGAGKGEKACVPLTAAERVRRLKNLKSGDAFAYKNVGYGLVSYERGGEKVWREKGNLFTSTFDRADGMKWNGQTWEFDGGLGLKTLIVLLEDVPEGELAD